MSFPEFPVSPSPIPLRDGGEVRLISRLSVAFLLDVIAIHRRGGRLIDALLLATISHANVADVAGRADLQLAYASAEEPPPDDVRRPVTLNALATSLNQPYETVRRRVNAMASAGLVELRPAGVIVPARALTSAAYLESALKGCERARRFYLDLRGAGLLDAPPVSAAKVPPGTAPVRLVARLTTDYLLRVTEAIIVPMGDLADGLIFLETFRSNVEHLPLDGRGGAALVPSDVLPDELRKPVSISFLAERLGLPHETARRHVARLQAIGALQRQSGGIIAPASALAMGQLRASMIANVSNLQRLFAALAKFGILDLWERPG
jgi:DNA-binding Lrp family transcriptional regulator